MSCKIPISSNFPLLPAPPDIELEETFASVSPQPERQIGDFLGKFLMDNPPHRFDFTKLWNYLLLNRPFKNLEIANLASSLTLPKFSPQLAQEEMIRLGRLLAFFCLSDPTERSFFEDRLGSLLVKEKERELFLLILADLCSPQELLKTLELVLNINSTNGNELISSEILAEIVSKRIAPFLSEEEEYNFIIFLSQLSSNNRLHYAFAGFQGINLARQWNKLTPKIKKMIADCNELEDSDSLTVSLDVLETKITHTPTTITGYAGGEKDDPYAPLLFQSLIDFFQRGGGFDNLDWTGKAVTDVLLFPDFQQFCLKEENHLGFESFKQSFYNSKKHQEIYSFLVKRIIDDPQKSSAWLLENFLLQSPCLEELAKLAQESVSFTAGKTLQQRIHLLFIYGMISLKINDDRFIARNRTYLEEWNATNFRFHDLTELMTVNHGSLFKDKIFLEQWEEICSDFQHKSLKLDHQDTDYQNLEDKLSSLYLEYLPVFPELRNFFLKNWQKKEKKLQPNFTTLLALAAKTGDQLILEMAKKAEIRVSDYNNLLEDLQKMPLAMELFYQRFAAVKTDSNLRKILFQELIPSFPSQKKDAVQNTFNDTVQKEHLFTFISQFEEEEQNVSPHYWNNFCLLLPAIMTQKKQLAQVIEKMRAKDVLFPKDLPAALIKIRKNKKTLL